MHFLLALSWKSRVCSTLSALLKSDYAQCRVQQPQRAPVWTTAEMKLCTLHPRFLLSNTLLECVEAQNAESGRRFGAAEGIHRPALQLYTVLWLRPQDRCPWSRRKESANSGLL